jgi:gas vesicle protein
MNKENKNKLVRIEKKVEDGIIATVIHVAAGISLIPKSSKKFRDDFKLKISEFRNSLAPEVKQIKAIGKKIRSWK